MKINNTAIYIASYFAVFCQFVGLLLNLFGIAAIPYKFMVMGAAIVAVTLFFFKHRLKSQQAKAEMLEQKKKYFAELERKHGKINI